MDVSSGNVSSKPTERRLALVLANGAYTQRAPLSRTVPTAVELQKKLMAIGFEVIAAFDQDLAGMRSATYQWLCVVEAAAGAAEEDGLSLLLFFAYCGHGRADQFLPVDAPRGVATEGAFCFFEEFVFRVYGLCKDSARFGLAGTERLRQQVGTAESCLRDSRAPWRSCEVRIISIIESCRKLSPEEKQEYEEERSRIAVGRRHLLPSLVAMRPELAHMGGAEWDAVRLNFLSNLGAGSPELLLALSSEATTPSYDVVFLRSITETLNRPVRFGGIIDRAIQDTLRRTGHKQKPVVLSFGDGLSQSLADRLDRLAKPALSDIILAPVAASATAARRGGCGGRAADDGGPGACAQRSSSSDAISSLRRKGSCSTMMTMEGSRGDSASDGSCRDGIGANCCGGGRSGGYAPPLLPRRLGISKGSQTAARSGSLPPATDGSGRTARGCRSASTVAATLSMSGASPRRGLSRRKALSLATLA
eukprot:TRINITY_DN30990_c0_g1_i1.p1 TRINITY_DN30990_c0_g1~~TRINITY_DN30990_c0_g1_i1.p1  ORF type:complete len:478 (-),score=82.54 TRINITY_DN30990_c0_g1_i1:84-1517(-)